ncbi:MAG TPA: DUF3368 domain-containing protein, partial [Saprospirales bacterium]|nr:DUF3368 domain-containing protein [Saprospirales bacterium]
TLTIFEKIDIFDLLNQIYGEVIITPEIAEEYGEKLPEWVRIQAVNDKKYFDFLNTQIDKGEASGLALASEF